MNSLGVPSYLYGYLTLNKTEVAAAVGALSAAVGAMVVYGAPHTWGIL